MSVSANGGRTWRAPRPTADDARGSAGQPLVQPDGRVVVPYFVLGLNSLIASFVSANGGASWSKPHVVSAVDIAADGGSIRNLPPSRGRPVRYGWLWPG